MLQRKNFIVFVSIFFGYFIIVALVGSLQISFQNIIVFSLLLVPTIMSLHTKSLSTIIFCSVALVTLTTTYSYFYIVRLPDWYLLKHTGFKGEALESSVIILTVVLFLIFTVFFVHIFRLLCFKCMRPYYLNIKEVRQFFTRRRARTSLYSATIYFLLTIVIILQYVMFLNGIGITGIDPPKLPYRAVGILFYSTKFLLPMLIGFLYTKSKNSFILFLMILCTGVVCGVLSASRAAGVIFIMPLLCFEALRFKFIRVIISMLFTAVVFSFASQMRSATQFVDASGRPASDIIGFEFTKFAVQVVNNLEVGSIIGISLNQFMSRIEGFENLVQAAHYNPYNVQGRNPRDLVLNILGRPPSKEIDMDQHHIEWQGYANPIGWYNGGSIFSDVVTVRHYGFGLWFILLSLSVAFWLLLIDLSVMRLLIFNPVNSVLALTLTGLLVLIFITSPGKTVLFISIAFAVFVSIIRTVKFKFR